MACEIKRKRCPAGLKNNPNRKMIAIEYITIHNTGNYSASATAKNHADYLYNGSGGSQASWHYTVDDKEIWQSFEDDSACWHAGDGNGKGNNASIGIEICDNNKNVFVQACDNGTYLTAELLKRHKLTIDRVVQHNRWSGKDCPKEIRSGAWGITWAQFLERVKGYLTPTAQESLADKAAKILELVKPNALKVGLFPSVKAAQMILESDYMRSELATNANNCFGMKKSLSGNAWAGSTWDGVSVYTKQTKEQDANGKETLVTADFRKYPSVENSIADHSAYLLGAKNGFALRYDGITKAANYREQIIIIKNGGYATDVTYVDKVCGIIEKYGLNKYDCKNEVETALNKLVGKGVINSPDYWLSQVNSGKVQYLDKLIINMAAVL